MSERPRGNLVHQGTATPSEIALSHAAMRNPLCITLGCRLGHKNAMNELTFAICRSTMGAFAA